MNRRELLKWSTPLVIVVGLPAHAQTTFGTITCDETDCVGAGEPLSVEVTE